MKICIISIAKKENRYINEWIDHHLNIGIDHIYICDNNNKNGESISDVVNNRRVTILNYRGVSLVQPKAYTECFIRYRKEYDWMLFIDIDEFVMLDNRFNNDIKQFISSEIFKDAQIIRLHWKVYSGGKNTEIYNNYNVLSRFTEIFNCKQNTWAKSIIKTTINYTGGKIYGHGYFHNKDIKQYVYNSAGQICQNDWAIADNTPIYDNAWINHYPTKTIKEYIEQKYFRGGPNGNDSKYSNLKYFFEYNPYDKDIEQYGMNKINNLKSQ